MAIVPALLLLTILSSCAPKIDWSYQPPDIQLIWPASGPVTSGFGNRWGRKHQGIDIGPGESTSVLAAASGIVKFAGKRRGFGKLIVLQHEGFQTFYAHNAWMLVDPGDQITQGQQIGKMGATGHATGTHLHFEVRQQGRSLDPSKYLPIRSLGLRQTKSAN